MKYFSIVILILLTLNSTGQTKSVYGEIHIESFGFKSDTFSFKTPKVVIIKSLGPTAIIPLGKLKQNEFAVQYELLKSDIGLSEYYMLGKVFFIKSNKDWKEISRFDYDRIIFNDGPRPLEIPNTNQGIYGAESDENSGFEFGSWYVFYKI